MSAIPAKSRGMCGIAGFVGGQWPGRGEITATLERMGASIHHRGPDCSDSWTDAESRVAFVHNRLAIVDLSAAGKQPMRSHSGRFVIIYNGEIYNHLQIREELAQAGHAINWNGYSDTETLLAAIDSWGIRAALERSTGMFAFALWDRAERSLTLARDRLGEKPLYYGRPAGPGGAFLFASELKALARHADFPGDIDRQALTLLLRYNYVPAPFSIYRGVAKLQPGTFCTLVAGASDAVVEEYWSGAEAAEAGSAHPLQLGDGEAIDALEKKLERAIAQQMMADVPLGAFLSGGIDSSLIVAVMQKLSPRPVKTFTVGFHEKDFNEADHAKAVAGHLGTDHAELYVSPEDTMAVIPRLPQIYDEPFADPSQIPTYLVSALAREEVTVSLSGDGGDEIFGGYTRYGLTAALWKRISGIPMPLRAAAARAVVALPPSAWSRVGNALSGISPAIGRMGEKIHKGAPLLESKSLADLYSGILSLWRDPASIVLETTEPQSLATGGGPVLPNLGGIERMMALDMLTYLPDDILVKVDRAAMAVSLETRVPYLDHHLVEFAWRLPFDLKIRNGETKWILRQILDRHVPRALIERPKRGFGIPLGRWMRGPLRDWAEALLEEQRLREEGYFRPEPIRQMWRRHLKGSMNEQYRLWGILMFQSWLESNRTGRAAAVDDPPMAMAG